MYLGIHAPTQGATTRFHQTASAMNAEAFLWLASERPNDTYNYPTAMHIVRLDNWLFGETPIGYCNKVAPTVNDWFSVPNVVFQCGNEPDVEAGHNGQAFPTVAAAMRARWPTILLANPPLRPENTDRITADACMVADFIAVHCYWQIDHPEDITNIALGCAYDRVLDYGVPVIVTEVNAVPASGDPRDTDIDWNERNAQVAKWASLAQGDGVHACCIYLADAADDWAGFDVGPEAATAIRAAFDDHNGDVPEPEPEPEPIPDPRPPDGGAPMDVYGDDLIAMFETQIGHPNSGDYDSHNGNHPWAYYCEAGVESTGRNCGLTVPARGSATGAGLIEAVEADLRHDEPQHGGVIVFGPSFYYPYGHTGYWNAYRQQLLGTLTDGTGVGYKSWGPQTAGYAGWYWLDGTVGPHRGVEPEPPPVNWLVQPDNPYQADGADEIGIGGGFLRYYNAVAIGQNPMVVVGYAKARENEATVTDDDGTARQRTIQRFQRQVLIYQPEQPPPWDVVAALDTQTIVDITS